jgi:hypothetical protein
MATINSTQLKDILQNETVFSEQENKVYQWVDDIAPWAVLQEGLTIEVADAFKVTNGDHTKIVSVNAGAAISGSFVSNAAIGNTNAQILPQLGKLDSSNSNTGVATIEGKVFKRNFAGSIGGVEYQLNGAPGARISDSDDLGNVDGVGSDNEFYILHAGQTAKIDSFYGNAELDETVPADTIFRIAEAATGDFTTYSDAGAATETGVQPGFYKTEADNEVKLTAGIFKNNLGGEILLAGGGAEVFTNAPSRAAAVPKTSSADLNADALVDVLSAVNEQLSYPKGDTPFWTEVSEYENPLSDAGAVNTKFTDENANNLQQGVYWNVISSGLAQDVVDGNTQMWTEAVVIESSDTLKYRE